MLFTIPQVPKHQAYRLNKHLRLFLKKLSTVNALSTFNPINNYFHSEFVTWLDRADQITLRGHFEDFFNIYKSLTDKQRQLLIIRFSDAQYINAILEDVFINGNELQAKSIPLKLRPSAKRLFKYLYKTTLGSFGNVKDHYRNLYKLLPSKTCPFCGIERLNPPSLRKQDYDHILIQSKYIYTSVNMNNLVPMGTECNRNFKGSKDVIYGGTKRVVYYSPFIVHYPITISLSGSIPPQDFDQDGNWIVKIHPDNIHTKRWDAVFKIKKRYSEQMLNGCYKEWMNDYKIYVKKQGLPTNSVEARSLFKDLADMLLQNPLSEPSLVKGAFYQFLSTYTHRSFNKAVLDYVTS